MFVLVLTSLHSVTRKIICLAASLPHARVSCLLQVMLELTQQSLAFQQERSQLTEMLQAQHVHMQQLVEENQTQEAALNGLSQHAQQADQKVQTDTTVASLADLYPGRIILQVCCSRALARMSIAVGYQSVSRHSHLQACYQCEFNS